MKRIPALLLSLILPFMHLNARESSGYVAYSTTNIGDDIQALAALQFLPSNALPIDREFLCQFQRNESIPVLMNGWFMHSKHCCWWSNQRPPNQSWPPSPSIAPLLISMHFTPTFFSKVLSEEGVEYLKQHGPVGARDLYSMKELEKLGVPTYFSGCLTLTLDNFYTDREDIIYAVDIDPAGIEYIRSKTKSKVISLGHGVPAHIQYNVAKRLKYAESLLNKYRKAKCVVTSRLHVAMPCLAFETPVLFFGHPDHGRFSGLAELTHRTSKNELLAGSCDFDFNNPPENPRDHLQLRHQLIEIVTNWIDETVKDEVLEKNGEMSTE